MGAWGLRKTTKYQVVLLGGNRTSNQRSFTVKTRLDKGRNIYLSGTQVKKNGNEGLARTIGLMSRRFCFETQPRTDNLHQPWETDQQRIQQRTSREHRPVFYSQKTTTRTVKMPVRNTVAPPDHAGVSRSERVHRAVARTVSSWRPQHPSAPAPPCALFSLGADHRQRSPAAALAASGRRRCSRRCLHLICQEERTHIKEWSSKARTGILGSVG